MQEVIWSSWDFEKHVLIHSGEKTHTCSECKKSFGQVGHLKGHMITHSKERAYACVQCQKSFGRATYLKRHMLTHSGVKAHSCSECEKSFSLVGHLRRHMVTHTGEKVHKCEECLDSFGQAGDLKRHKLIHSGEKPQNAIMQLHKQVILEITSKRTPQKSQINAIGTNFLQSQKRSYPTSSHPQWREAASLLRVRELIQPSRNSEEAHPRSHWRKAIQVHKM